MEQIKWKLFGEDFEEDFDVEGKFTKEDAGIDNNRMKRNFSNDIKERQDSEIDRSFELSDVVCDMHLVLMMRKLVMNPDIFTDTKSTYVHNLSVVNELLIQYIWGAKNTIIEIRRRHRYLTDYEKLSLDFSELLYTYIEEIRDVINRRGRLEERRLHANDLLNRLNKADSIFPKVSLVFNNLEKNVQRYEQNHENRWVDKSLKSSIYSGIRSIPDALSLRYQESSELRKYMNKLYRYYPSRTDMITTQVIINVTEFDKHINHIVNRIVNDMSAMEERVCNNRIIDNHSFLNEIADMRKHIDNTPADFGHYRGKKPGCFSLMDLKYSANNNKQIFAFSNMFDCDDENINSYFGIINTKEGLRKELISMQKKILNGAEWAKTVKEMKRYFFDSGKKKLPNPAETVYDAIQNSKGTKEEKSSIRGDFSCCERKMIPQIDKNVMGPIDECNLFTRHSICFKCEPAIADFKNAHSIGSIHSYYIENDEVKDTKI